MAVWLSCMCGILIRQRPLVISFDAPLCTQVDFQTRACSAHSHSTMLAFCSSEGSHASPHYLLSPPVMAVCYYGDRPCNPARGRVRGAGWENKSAIDVGRFLREGGEEGSVSDEGGNGRRRGELKKDIKVKVSGAATNITNFTTVPQEIIWCCTAGFIITSCCWQTLCVPWLHLTLPLHMLALAYWAFLYKISYCQS